MASLLSLLREKAILLELWRHILPGDMDNFAALHDDVRAMSVQVMPENLYGIV